MVPKSKYVVEGVKRRITELVAALQVIVTKFICTPMI